MADCSTACWREYPGVPWLEMLLAVTASPAWAARNPVNAILAMFVVMVSCGLPGVRGGALHG